MEMMYGVVFGFLALEMLLHVHAQTGFISIDCGSDQDYFDDATTLYYSKDAGYIDSGENVNINLDFPSIFYQKQFETIRNFPYGVKNCYTLPAAKGSKYLIRAVFMCGNVPEYNGQCPEFLLYLGVEKWATVTFNATSYHFIEEMIYVPDIDEIYVCLVNIGFGTPFISALELRPMNNSLYNVTPPGPLQLFNRLNFGAAGNNPIRYPDDNYLDRLWYPFAVTGWENITAPYSSSGLGDSKYKLPANVMEMAVKPANGTSLDFYLEGIDSSQQFYLYFHVAEVETLAQGQTREFTFSVNNHTFDTVIQPRYMVANTYYTPSSLSKSSLSFSLAKTNESTLPPILNALEIYMFVEFQQLPTEQSNTDAMITIKQTYQVNKSGWQGDPCLPTSYKWDGLICSDSGYNAPSITSLNMSFSNLTGTIDKSFSSLESLESLDLSNNRLYGEVPEFLSKMQSLKTLNLSWNNLTGSVPSDLLAKHDDGSLFLSWDGNPGLCKTNACSIKKKNKNSVVAPVVGSIAGFLVLLGALFAIYWYSKIHRRQGKPSGVKPNDQESAPPIVLEKPDAPSEEEHSELQMEKIQSEVTRSNEKLKAIKRQRFSYSEVKMITNSFGKIIGQGGSGFVYSGNLSNGTKVAVKKLSPSSHQALEQFQNEAQLLLKVHHRSLVSLLGYCDEGSNMLLIYEYMANGNLKEHLSGKTKSALSWERRLQIAIEAAQALEYLHDGCSPSIIHRDVVKAANILLNENMQAKVADFGWSRSIPFENPTHVSTTFVVGTSGYLDPMYSSTGQLTKESDVYSFGIVLLELISGRPAKMADNRGILAWFNPTIEKGEIEEIMDPRLLGDFHANSAWRAIDTAISCVKIISTERPTMSYVVIELKESLKLMDMSSASNTETTVTRPIEPVTGPRAR